MATSQQPGERHGHEQATDGPGGKRREINRHDRTSLPVPALFTPEDVRGERNTQNPSCQSPRVDGLRITVELALTPTDLARLIRPGPVPHVAGLGHRPRPPGS